MIGKRIAHYNVTDKIGAGGMGEVYRARDTKLGRDVALKFLPDVFAADPDRLGRFEREAKLLASLNHPNIASIYGIESDGGKQVLVLELVEGEDLSVRISRGALPLEETLAIAAQVAVALEAAHEQGVIHRDLKPANIKVTPDGTVKVLDFGLAKALDTDPSASGSGNLSHSPTVLGGSSPTVQGVILGTAAYMSPEQARGRQVDKRADIFAFGCVVFEMLTGSQAFGGETISDTLASILAREPDLKQLPAATPRALRRLLERCLEKDAKKRLRDIGEARLAIDAIRRGETGDAPEVAGVAAAAPSRGRGGLLSWALVAVLAVAAAWLMMTRGGGEPPELLRVEISAPPDAPFELSSLHPGPATISPDGKYVTFSARGGEGTDVLWVRTLSDDAARPLSGTEGAGYPFWSPNSRTIGFIAQGLLKKVDISGAPPFTLASAPVGKGGSWNADNIIIFAPTFNGPILKVSAAGGEADTVTVVNAGAGENSHRFPSFLPDGMHFLYFVRTSSQGRNEQSSIWVGSLDRSVNKRLFACRSQAQYVAGHILYLQDGTLMARAFNVDALEFTGDPFALVGQVQFLAPASRGVFSASETNRLVFLKGVSNPGSNLVWLDRKGQEVDRLGDRAQYAGPRLSPDGKNVVVEVTDASNGSWDLWTFDVARGVRSRFTFGPDASSGSAAWSADGRSIVYRRDKVPEADIYIRSFAGTDTPSVFVKTPDVDAPSSWSGDGRYLSFSRFGSLAGDVWVYDVKNGGDPVPFANTKFNEMHSAFSPDGKWLAYVSDESGRTEVYIAPYPGPGRKWQVSTSGGFRPHWRGDGREIFFASGNNKLASAEISYVGDAIAIGEIHELFDYPASGSDYDVTKDGQRFLIVKEEGQVDEPITLILNWTELIPKKN